MKVTEPTVYINKNDSPKFHEEATRICLNNYFFVFVIFSTIDIFNNKM